MLELETVTTPVVPCNIFSSWMEYLHINQLLEQKILTVSSNENEI
ncbi:hypothetical protein [Antarcticibacterium sp. 1MA-6-2]|nr:hypothetical protein [Antarcticibacterium sp. 1MA-6-2]